MSVPSNGGNALLAVGQVSRLGGLGVLQSITDGIVCYSIQSYVMS